MKIFLFVDEFDLEVRSLVWDKDYDPIIVEALPKREKVVEIEEESKAVH